MESNNVLHLKVIRIHLIITLLETLKGEHFDTNHQFKCVTNRVKMNSTLRKICTFTNIYICKRDRICFIKKNRFQYAECFQVRQQYLRIRKNTYACLQVAYTLVIHKWISLLKRIAPCVRVLILIKYISFLQ